MFSMVCMLSCFRQRISGSTYTVAHSCFPSFNGRLYSRGISVIKSRGMLTADSDLVEFTSLLCSLDLRSWARKDILGVYILYRDLYLSYEG